MLQLQIHTCHNAKQRERAHAIERNLALAKQQDATVPLVQEKVNSMIRSISATLSTQVEIKDHRAECVVFDRAHRLITISTDHSIAPIDRAFPTL
jgi:hypothetical protein